MHRSEMFIARLATAATLLACSTGALAAQQRPVREGRTPVTAQATPVIVVRGSTEPTFRRSGDWNSSPTPLSASQKAEIFSTALEMPVLVTGVGQGIRLTPSQPFVAGKARLEFAAAAVVLPDNDGGIARMISNPSIGLSSAVACSFWPTVVNQPLLIDVTLSVLAIKSKVSIKLYIPGGQFNQTVQLSAGDHHLTAIYKPADLSEKSLIVEDASDNPTHVSFTFYACEITPLVK